MEHNYEWGLEKNPANFQALTPLDFIKRAAEVYPLRTAVIHGKIKRNWKETYLRCLKLASALQKRGIKRGDTIAIMLPNIPQMVEAHYAIPMCGAV